MPYWPTKPKSVKERREVLHAERERLQRQLDAQTESEAQRAQQAAEAAPELAAAFAAQQEVNERVARAQAAMGGDPGGMGGLLREQQLRGRLDEITDELEELQL